ncbi:hypothetical protein ACFOQM_01165 [Paenibacillus sp. GCM10012307]|uniref:Uncharacterized protein n=1 Tax=Paenibacillus roseus TaxID=2798579 RepID=A0A934MNK2_9BACL|nr:hypothetical protein [Paenibacillus roseus]MBJ6359933.1 hypothetical protein [Paenibacillus roseus]
MKPFHLTDLNMESFYYIAHLLDRVLVGNNTDSEYSLLEVAIDKGMVIEAHFFNKEQEVYVVQDNNLFRAYEPLIHNPVASDDSYNRVIERSYQIEDNKSRLYNTLVVKEYLDYEDNLAYVKKTVLFALEYQNWKEKSR